MKGPKEVISDSVIVHALEARWDILYPNTKWYPKWDKKDKEAMRAAIETVMLTYSEGVPNDQERTDGCIKP